MIISHHIKFGSAGKLDSIFLMISMPQLFWPIASSTLCGNIADLGALFNVVSQDEHVPEVEQYNRTIKEHVRANYNILPFTHIPPMFIIKMVYHIIFCCNLQVNVNAHGKIEFQEYVQMHKEHDHSMQSHTVGAIATHPMAMLKVGFISSA